MSNFFYEKKVYKTLEYIRELEYINNFDLSWLDNVVIDCILGGGLIKPEIEYDNCNLFLKWENNYFCAIAMIEENFVNFLLFNENFTIIHEFNNLECFTKTIKKYFYHLFLIGSFKYIKNLKQGWYDGVEGCSYEDIDIEDVERFIIKLQKKCSCYLYVYPSLDNNEITIEFSTNTNFFSIVVNFKEKEYQFEILDIYNHSSIRRDYKFYDEQEIILDLPFLFWETYEG